MNNPLFSARKIFLFALVAHCVACVAVVNAQENIVNKADTDRAFELSRSDWEASTRSFEVPEGWTLKILPFESGSAVAAFDKNTGFGLQVQPMYRDGYPFPEMLIVGSWYPAGLLPVSQETYEGSSFKTRIEAGAREDLGLDYSFSTVFQHAPPYDGIMFMIRKK